VRPNKTQKYMPASYAADALDADGFVRIDGPFQTSDGAFDAAGALIEECRLQRGLPAMSIVGDFVIPPLDGPSTRDFQTLHFDFGLPLDPKMPRTSPGIPRCMFQRTSSVYTRQRAWSPWSHCWASAPGRNRRSSLIDWPLTGERTAPGTMTEATQREASRASSRPPQPQAPRSSPA